MAFPRAKATKTPEVSTIQRVTASRLESRNPWDHDNLFIKNSRDALILAEQMNIKTLENELNCVKTLAESPSSKLINLQREITEKRKTIMQKKQEIMTCHLHARSADILNLDVIEKRINMIKQMCDDLDSVLKNKDKIIARLQTPFVGDHLKIEARYHKYIHEVFTDLVPTVINLGPYLDNLRWLAYKDLDAAFTEPLMVEIQSMMASLQTSYQMLFQMKSGVKELCQKSMAEGDAENNTQHSSFR